MVNNFPESVHALYTQEQLLKKILQVEKLICYYDSKKLPSRFNSNLKSLELTLSTEMIYFKNLSELTDQLNLIKTEFACTKTNEQKRHLIFKVLFFHINILFAAYQAQVLKNNNLAVENAYAAPKLETHHDVIEKINKESDEKLETLSTIQQQKYLKLQENLKNTEDPREKNRIRANIAHYKKLIANKK
jgi:hypothetical protein